MGRIDGGESRATMHWYENAAIVGPLVAVVVAFAPRVFAYLTHHRSIARAETLKEIQVRTAGHADLIKHLRDEVDRLTTQNRELMQMRLLNDEYIDALEEALRAHDIRLPVPPWAQRRKSGGQPREE